MLCWVFVAVLAFSPVVASWGYSSWSVWASLCGGFSLWWLLLLQSARASADVARGLSSWGSQALGHRPNNCGARASLVCSMWGLPGSRIKPMSPALAGGNFITEVPGKPSAHFFISTSFWYIRVKFFFIFVLLSLLPISWFKSLACTYNSV